jgi:hypothetical protein
VNKKGSMAMHSWLAGWHGHLRAWLSLTCTATHFQALDIAGHTLTTSMIKGNTDTSVLRYAPGLYIELVHCVRLDSFQRDPWKRPRQCELASWRGIPRDGPTLGHCEDLALPVCWVMLRHWHTPAPNSFCPGIYMFYKPRLLETDNKLGRQMAHLSFKRRISRFPKGPILPLLMAISNGGRPYVC